MDYQCSVYCHCGRPSIDVDCYGTFEYCEGVCPRCGAIHIGGQIPLSSNEYRYVTEIRHTIKSTILYAIENIRLTMEKR